MAGLIQTALIVGVLSDTLLVGPDEKRIMASVEKTRVMQLRVVLKLPVIYPFLLRFSLLAFDYGPKSTARRLKI